MIYVLINRIKSFFIYSIPIEIGYKRRDIKFFFTKLTCKEVRDDDGWMGHECNLNQRKFCTAHLCPKLKEEGKKNDTRERA